MTAFADDVSFTSTGGTFSGTSFGYVLSNATLTGISGLAGNSYTGTDLGTVSFSTAKLGSISNVISGGNVLAGGNLTITANGTDGLAAGTLFSGTFGSTGMWGYVLQSDGTHLYTLTTDVMGQDSLGNSEQGIMTFSINTGMNIFPGYTSQSGTGVVSMAVPEPGELTMVGFGLLGLVGVIRRKASC
jgi:hypothetical protein